GMMLVDRAMALTDGAATALLPAVANLSGDSPAKAAAVLRKSALWLLLLTLPVALITLPLSPLMVRIVFGPKYAGAALILAIGIWRLPAMCLNILSGYSLLAVKRQDLELRTSAAGTLLSLALIVPLIYRFGPVGGAAALALRPAVAAL